MTCPFEKLPSAEEKDSKDLHSVVREKPSDIPWREALVPVTGDNEEHPPQANVRAPGLEPSLVGEV